MDRQINQLHAVLGSSGVIGKAVVTELKNRNLPTRLVERSNKTNNPEVLTADLLDLEQTKNAILGATHVYLCIGLPYDKNIWKSQWPIIMKNVIIACEQAHAKIIFFDNIYMYGPSPLPVPITENTQQEPTSQKGVIRKEIADMLLSAHNAGRINAVIGRSADFYGPRATTSMLYQTIFSPILSDKKTQWIGSTTAKHTLTYTLDNARALVQLALDDSAYGQAWHLPVETPAISITDLMNRLNLIQGTSVPLTTVPGWLVPVLKLFIQPLRELSEMLYQYENDYILSDAKFRTRYPDFKTTPYTIGLKETMESFKK